MHFGIIKFLIFAEFNENRALKRYTMKSKMSSRKNAPGCKDSEHKENDGKIAIKVAERPTFILKTREGENRAVSPNHRNGTKY